MNLNFRRSMVELTGILFCLVLANAQDLQWEPVRGPLSLPANNGYELGGVVGFSNNLSSDFNPFTVRLRVFDIQPFV